MNFNLPYDRGKYIEFFRNQFLPEDFDASDESISLSFSLQYTQQVTKIGQASSLDLNVYEVQHTSENDPRVSLSKESFKLLAEYGEKRALVLFTSKKPSTNYRLSLVTIDLKWEEGKRPTREYSNPKRFSFFLGPDAKVHTPEQYLVGRGRVKDFGDLRDRFSIEVVNKDFYAEIAKRFTELTGGKRKIGSRSFEVKTGVLVFPSPDDTKRKEFAVRLIGRLIFCWFLKKKHSDGGSPLLPEELLSSEGVKRNRNYYHSVLEPLFFEVLNSPMDERPKQFQSEPWSLIPFLNGGLFTDHEDDFYGRNENERAQSLNTLVVSNDWLKKLVGIFETYNFTIDENTPVDVELSIEPEMLGRIFENLLAEINPETGETARKATGSYYTPRPIVEYMVNESLKQYLLTKTGVSESKIASLLSYAEDEPDLSESQIDEVLDALDTIIIIDPACGSGAFPMGILQKILLILQKIDPDSQKWLSKILAKIENATVRTELAKKLKDASLDYVHKLGIIQSSIYGVDIQPIAIDISKLRCFLSLIVDESIDDAKKNRGIEPLPNLEFKFVCANTLIGLPEKEITANSKKDTKGQSLMFEASDQIKELKELREKYLRSYGKEKQRIEERFRKTQGKMFEHALNWGGKETQTLKLSQWNPFSDEPCHWFDPEWMFGAIEGFDVVIVNPPYVQIKQIPWDDRKVYEKKFKSAVGRFNLFYFFLEFASKTAKQGGVSTFIVPDRLLLNTQCDKLRKWLLQEQQIIEIDSFDEAVFEAVVDNIVIIYKNSQDSYDNVKAKSRVLLDNLEKIEPKLVPILYFLNSPNSQFDLNYDPKNDITINKIKNKSVQLCSIAEIKDGIIQGKIADMLFLKKTVDQDSKRLLFGQNVVRYNITFDNNWVNYKPEEMMDLEVKRRGPGVRHGLWMRNPKIFERNKILTRQTADEIIAAYDTNDFYYSNTLHGTSITDSDFDPYYVLAILNSKLTNWYYRTTTGESGKVFAQIKIAILKQLPILEISAEQQKPLISLVDKILNITKSKKYLENRAKQAKVKELEKQIDQMVYKLYGLTKEEITIVEGEK